jgi:hypothetical protein
MSPQWKAFLRYLLVPLTAFIVGAVGTLFVLPAKTSDKLRGQWSQGHCGTAVNAYIAHEG